MGSLALLGAVALAVLTACGGGDDTASESATATAASADGALTAEHGVTQDDQKVLTVGASGFVAQALSVGKSRGTSSDFHVLVVGDADKIDAATKAQIIQALESGKQVVLDGPSDSSGRIVHNELLMELTGMSLGSTAVRIQKDPQGKGYYVTPIDGGPTSSSASDTTMKARSLQGTSQNTVASIFGMSGSSK